MKQFDRVRRFFQSHTNAAIHDIQMNHGDNTDNFNNRFAMITGRLGLGDLIIVYYHGAAGNNGEGYTW